MSEAASHDDQGPEASARIAELYRATARLQHEINNPLAALLAEAQLLALDETLNEEHQRSVGRIIDLTRRVAESVRKFDELRGEKTVGQG